MYANLNLVLDIFKPNTNTNANMIYGIMNVIMKCNMKIVPYIIFTL